MKLDNANNFLSILLYYSQVTTCDSQATFIATGTSHGKWLRKQMRKLLSSREIQGKEDQVTRGMTNGITMELMAVSIESTMQ